MEEFQMANYKIRCYSFSSYSTAQAWAQDCRVAFDCNVSAEDCPSGGFQFIIDGLTTYTKAKAVSEVLGIGLYNEVTGTTLRSYSYSQQATAQTWATNVSRACGVTASVSLYPNSSSYQFVVSSISSTLKAQAMGRVIKNALYNELTEVDTYTYPTPENVRSLSQGYDKNGHRAIDIPAAVGTPIYAFTDGVVVYSQNATYNWKPSEDTKENNEQSMSSMGNMIAINHINPDPSVKSGAYARTIYMHMRDNPYLKAGNMVEKGQIIGYIGNTGRSEGAHLHFTLAVGDDAFLKPGNTTQIKQSDLPTIDPREYLPDYQ